MGQTHERLDERLRAFIGSQHVFYVGTAPSGDGGHINVSPKGLKSFRVLDDSTVAYLDFVGSGVETLAHLRQNGRICIMFCAFDGPPRIVRLHGHGEGVEPGDDRFAGLRELFTESRTARSVVVVRVTRISDSCGFGVPRYDYVTERTQLGEWADRKGDEGLGRYQLEKNARSIDGLPGLRWASR